MTIAQFEMSLETLGAWRAALGALCPLDRWHFFAAPIIREIRFQERRAEKLLAPIVWC